MEASAQNNLLGQAPLPHTPKQKQAGGPPVVKNTPGSHNYTAHAKDKVPQRASVLNKFLQDDISDRAVLSLDDFATLILDLPLDWRIKEEFSLLPESEVVRETFEAYLTAAIGATEGEGKRKKKGKAAAVREKELYQPLANLLNSLRDGTGRHMKKDIDEKIFYVQDPRPLLGSLLERKPDLGVIYIQLLELTKNAKLSKYLGKNKIAGVFWGLLLFFVEVKHEKGRFIGLNITKEETGSPKDVSSGSFISKTSKHESTQASKTAPGSSQLNPSNFRSMKRPRPVEELESDISRVSKRVKSHSTAQSESLTLRRSQRLARSTGSSYRVQSGPLPSIRHSGSASTPPASATTSFGDEHRPRVTIHQSGGKEKTLEVGSSQEYALRAEEELKEERLLTPTQGQHRTRIQCASYAKEMLSNGFIRNHAIGILADDDGFRFHYYDRSKVVESEAFNILDDEWKKLFMAMVCQLNKLSSEKLGFIPNLHLDEYDHLRDPEQFSQQFANDPQGLVGASYSFKGSDGVVHIVVIEQVLYRAEGIIGRCSVVVEVTCICQDSGCKWNGERKIMKISFPSKSRPSEEGLIYDARSKAESSGEHWALNHLPKVIDSITLPYHEKETVQGRLKTHLKDKYEERVMRVTILEKLHPLSELEDPREFAQVFYDVLQIHQWLYECVGILHRDLSSGNIMFRRKDDKIYGVLNDFDLSSRVADMDKGPTSNQRTGTRPFMSRDLLCPTWTGGHLYRHDLESLFYIMLCLACRYKKPGLPTAEPRAYSKWFSGTDEEVYDNKNSFYSDHNESFPIQPYFTHFRTWLHLIFRFLSAGYKARPSLELESEIASYDLDTLLALRDSLQDPELEEFDWSTLNGRVTYLTFRRIMSSFQAQPLETRWSSGNLRH
ncbi:protein kinase [Lentinula lateritia]|uniref:Protein kinase n=1 Tax=Lentinula lateritia TaxID=40482 RepID=A0ABQ8VWM2_9AGAR|nr:protein kinase [Lentinula lateritia]